MSEHNDWLHDLGDDEVIAVRPLLDFDAPEPPAVSGDDLTWATDEVLGVPESEETMEARSDAEVAQAVSDAIAGGCPPEEAQTVGLHLVGYRAGLVMLRRMVALYEVSRAAPPPEDLDQRAEYVRHVAMEQKVIEATVNFQRQLGSGPLNRTPEMIQADLDDARDRGRDDARRILSLAIGRSRGGGVDG